VTVKNSTNINKTKESLISDGQEFHQYQQNKKKLNQFMRSVLQEFSAEFKQLLIISWISDLS
jgi:hypothetical protein